MANKAEANVVKKVEVMNKELVQLSEVVAKLAEGLSYEESLRKREIRALNVKVDPLEKRLDTFDPHITEKFLKSIEDDTRYLHERLQLLILKQTVATETFWFAQRAIPEAANVIGKNSILAMENPDEWWAKRKGWTLDEWMEELCNSMAQVRDPRDCGKVMKRHCRVIS